MGLALCKAGCRITFQYEARKTTAIRAVKLRSETAIG